MTRPNLLTSTQLFTRNIVVIRAGNFCVGFDIRIFLASVKMTERTEAFIWFSQARRRRDTNQILDDNFDIFSEFFWVT